MRSITQILALPNDKVGDAMFQYLSVIQKMFPADVQIIADNLLMVISELLPSDPDELARLNKKIDTLLNDNRYGMGEGGYAITQIGIAIENKLTEMKAGRNLFKDSQNPAHEKKELVMIKEALAAVQKLYKITGERIILTTAMFEELNVKFPGVIPQEDLDRLQVDYLKLQQNIFVSDNTDVSSEEITIVNNFNASIQKIITKVLADIKQEMAEVKLRISPKAYNQLSHEYSALTSLTEVLLQPSADIKVFQQKIDELIKALAIKEKINDLPLQHEQLQYREDAARLKSSLFKEELVVTRLGTNKYPYVIAADTMRASENPMFKEAARNNFVFAENDPEISKLQQMLEHGTKGLLINQTPIMDLSGDEVTALIRKTFGEHADSVLGHYNPRLSYLPFTAIQKLFFSAAGTGQEIGFSKQAVFEDDIRLFNNIPLRESTLNNLYLNVPEDEEHLSIEVLDKIERGEPAQALLDDWSGMWKFKCNLKMVSILTQGGYEVIGFGTDSAIVASMLQNKSTPRAHLREFVKAVIELQNDIKTIATELHESLKTVERGPSYYRLLSQLDLLHEMLENILRFKNGELDIPEFLQTFVQMKQGYLEDESEANPLLVDKYSANLVAINAKINADTVSLLEMHSIIQAITTGEINERDDFQFIDFFKNPITNKTLYDRLNAYAVYFENNSSTSNQADGKEKFWKYVEDNLPEFVTDIVEAKEMLKLLSSYNRKVFNEKMAGTMKYLIHEPSHLDYVINDLSTDVKNQYLYTMGQTIADPIRSPVQLQERAAVNDIIFNLAQAGKILSAMITELPNDREFMEVADDKTIHLQTAALMQTHAKLVKFIKDFETTPDKSASLKRLHKEIEAIFEKSHKRKSIAGIMRPAQNTFETIPNSIQAVLTEIASSIQKLNAEPKAVKSRFFSFNPGKKSTVAPGANSHSRKKNR